MIIETETDLREAIEDTLTPELCMEIVNLGYSEDNKFSKDVFTEARVFFDDILSALDPEEIALRFFNGDDLDSKGAANPNRDYFRYNSKENIESTDYPEDLYYDELLDDIVDYIIEHLEDTEWPEEIQNLVDDYFAE